MTDARAGEDATLFPKTTPPTAAQTAGERLRAAREAQGLSLAEIAARTRVPVRQLEAVETSNFEALPSITYSVGFAKAYARAVGIDEVEVAREVRGHSAQAPAPRRMEYEAYTADELSARTPSRGLVLGAVLVALLVAIGAALWYGTGLFRDGSDGASTVAVGNAVPEAPAIAAPTSAAPLGPVVLTATDEVWLKVYDPDKTLFQGTLKAGERYEVPADATNPMINVGRPDKLQVTVGGTTVAPLGTGRVAIKDVGIGAAALTARGSPQPAPSATPSAPNAMPGATSAARSAPAGASTPAAQRRATTPPRERRDTTPGPSLNIAAPAPVVPEPATSAPAATPAP